MPIYLPIRAISRTNKVRIGLHQVTPYATTYIQLDSPRERRDLERHFALGAITVVGPIIGNPSGLRVVYGAAITQGTSASDKILGITAGEIRKSDNTYIPISATNAAITLDAAESGTNEVQTITVTATGGTYTLSFNGAGPCVPIPFNADPDEVEFKLQELATIQLNGVAVTGSTGGPYTVTFGGLLAYQNVPQITATSSLTGPSAGVAISTSTVGVGPAYGRKDIVWVDAAGVIGKTKGPLGTDFTAMSATQPAVPTGKLLLAVILRDVNDDAISTYDIIDSRNLS